MKKVLALLLAVVMIAGMLSACGGAAPSETSASSAESQAESKSEEASPAESASEVASSEAGSEEAPSEPAEEAVTVIWKLTGTAPTNADTVTAKIKEEVLKNLNVDLQLDFIDGDEYEDRMTMMMSAGEDWDIQFCSNWLNSWTKNIDMQAYAPIEDLLADNAPFLTNLLPASVWDGLKYKGHVYTISYATELGIKQRCAMIHKQLCDDAGIEIPDVLTGYDELLEICEKLHEAYPDNIVAGKFFPDTYSGLFEARGFKEWVDGAGLALIYDPETGEVTYDYWDVSSPEWAAYHELIDKGIGLNDVTFEPEDSMYADGYIMVHRTTWTGAKVQSDYGVDWYAPKWGTTSILGNSNLFSSMLAFNAKSEHVDKAIQVVDFLASRPDLAMLLCYGEEGTDYTIEDDVIVIPPEGWSNQVWSWGMGPLYRRAITGYFGPDDGDPEAAAAMDEALKTAYVSKLMGFQIDTTPIEAEVAACTAIYNDYSGLYKYDPNYESLYQEYLAKVKDAGADKIVEEVNRQLAEFFAG